MFILLKFNSQSKCLWSNQLRFCDCIILMNTVLLRHHFTQLVKITAGLRYLIKYFFYPNLICYGKFPECV
jgi:hypothetical protein